MPVLAEPASSGLSPVGRPDELSGTDIPPHHALGESFDPFECEFQHAADLEPPGSAFDPCGFEAAEFGCFEPM